jgi:hypothetical protein
MIRDAGNPIGAGVRSCGTQRAGLPAGQHILAVSIAAAELAEQQEQRCEPLDETAPQVASSMRHPATVRRTSE